MDFVSTTCETCGKVMWHEGGVVPRCSHTRGTPQATARPSAWHIIHSRYAAAIQSGKWSETVERHWLDTEFSRLVPCGACGSKWTSLAATIDLCSAERAFESTWLAHNRVSTEHVQPALQTITYTQCRAIYLGERTSGKCIVTLATGPATAILDVSRGSIQAYAERCGAQYVELKGVTEPWWGLEKFRVHNLARAYDRTLFFDCDLLIRNDCPDLFKLVPKDHVAMHDDWPYLQSHQWLEDERRSVFKSQRVVGDYPQQALNSGVVLCCRAQADIWKRPSEEPFPTSHCAEQIWIEFAARHSQIFKLPTQFNTQWWMREFEQLKPSAAIVHWANDPNKSDSMMAYRREIDGGEVS